MTAPTSLPPTGKVTGATTPGGVAIGRRALGSVAALAALAAALALAVAALSTAAVVALTDGAIDDADAGEGRGLLPLLRRRRLLGEEHSSTKIWEEEGMRKNADGWKPVHVFFGDKEHLMQGVRQRPSYSQAGQDALVIKLLGNKNNGYFIDLAANDAVHMSNTLALERYNDWTGLCVEPNPAYWYRLAHRRCHVIGSLVGKNDGEEVMVRFDNGALGGIVNDGFDNTAEKAGEAPLEKRYTARMETIFKKFHVPSSIDYLSLDVEGAELFIMESFPFSEYHFKVLTVERPSAELQDLLRRNGYEFIKLVTNWGETLWVHQSMLNDDVVKEIADDEKPCWPWNTCH